MMTSSATTRRSRRSRTRSFRRCKTKQQRLNERSTSTLRRYAAEEKKIKEETEAETELERSRRDRETDRTEKKGEYQKRSCSPFFLFFCVFLRFVAILRRITTRRIRSCRRCITVSALLCRRSLLQHSTNQNRNSTTLPSSLSRETEKKGAKTFFLFLFCFFLFYWGCFEF